MSDELILTIDRLESREDDMDIFDLPTVWRPLEDALLAVQRHLAFARGESGQDSEGSFEVKWSRLFPDASYGLVAHLELLYQVAGTRSEAYGEGVIETLLDTSTCPQSVRDRLYEVSGALPYGVVMFIGNEDERRKIMFERMDEFPLERSDPPDFHPLSSESPFESTQDVLDFFRACAELEGPGVEPDWGEHLRVIGEARSRG